MSNLASSPIKAEIHSDPSLNSSANSPLSPSPMPNGVSGISDTVEYTVESLPKGTIKSETHTPSPKTERVSHDSTLDQWSAKSEEPTEVKMEPSPEPPRGVKLKDSESESSDTDGNIRELKQLASMWIDDLIELTIDIPQRVTPGMLALRMCIELARTGQPLTAAQEVMLRDAVKKLEAEAEEWENEEGYIADQSTIDGSDSD
jgi:hypothetical protein